MENVLHSMGGVSAYGIISICLFFAVFTSVLVWTICLKKPYLKAMQELPLEESSTADADLAPNPENRHD